MMRQKQIDSIKEEYSNMNWEDFRENAGDLITREIDIYNTVVIEGVPALLEEIERLQIELTKTDKCYGIIEKAAFKANELLIETRKENEQLREALEKSETKCKHLSTSLHRTKQERDAAKVKWKDQMNYASRVKSSMKQLQRQLDYAERQLHKKRGR